MTLAQDTEALLLDEPTTFLDLAHQVEVLDLLHRLRTERGRTVVAVLHDLNQAARYADHLIAMRDGRVVAAGPPREILTADLVRDVFGLDCVVVPCPVTGAPLVVPGTTRRTVADPLDAPPLRTGRPSRKDLMRRLAAALAAALAVGAASPAAGRATRSPHRHRGDPADHPRDGHHHRCRPTPKRVVVLDTDKIDTALSLGRHAGRRRPPRARLKGWPTYFGDREARRHQGGRGAHRARPGGDHRAASRT